MMNGSNHPAPSFWKACENGSVDEIQNFLQNNKGFDVNTQNTNGDTAAHIVAYNGQTEVFKLLHSNGLDPTRLNKVKETVLHCAVKYGHAQFILELKEHLEKADKIFDMSNEDGDAAIHLAAGKGDNDALEALCILGVDIDLPDKKKNTALHIACLKHHTETALLLIQLNCRLDLRNMDNNTALHLASTEGTQQVVQSMCACGCPIDMTDSLSLSALHLASKRGHIEVVRTLLLSGADIDLPTQEGNTAEELARAQGYTEVADLLAKLTSSITRDRREPLVKSLMPTNLPVTYIKLKVLGNSGVGKTTLIESFKCSFLWSWFRKATSNESSSVLKGIHNKRMSTASEESIQMHSFQEPAHQNYTRGINSWKTTISGIGDLRIVEFSGYEPYYVFNDEFVGDQSSIYTIVVSLNSSQHTIQKQLNFWLNYIRARIGKSEPVGSHGYNIWAPNILIVATHPDKSNCMKNNHGEWQMRDAKAIMDDLQRRFSASLNIVPHIFVLNAHDASSSEIKSMKRVIGEMKTTIVRCHPQCLGILEDTMDELPNWSKILGKYPVVTWQRFVEYIRAKVNILATEEHIRELSVQLQITGDIVCLKHDELVELIIINPKWLFNDIIGHMFAYDTVTLTKTGGNMTMDELQAVLGNKAVASEVIPVLEALEICVKSNNPSDSNEYEIPSYNTMMPPEVLWINSDENDIYGGIRISCNDIVSQMYYVFPRLQVWLKRAINISDEAYRIKQWNGRTHISNGNLEGVIIMKSGREIDVICKGPNTEKEVLFHFHSSLCAIVFDSLEESIPGVYLERNSFSAKHLKEKVFNPRFYTPTELLRAQQERRHKMNLDDNTLEDLVDVVGFGSADCYSCLRSGLDLHVSHMSLQGRYKLAELLDADDPSGRDWRMLAGALGLQEEVTKIDEGTMPGTSKTDNLLALWSQKADSTVRILLEKVCTMTRPDLVEMLLKIAPIYRYYPNENKGGGREIQLKRESMMITKDSAA